MTRRQLEAEERDMALLAEREKNAAAALPPADEMSAPAEEVIIEAPAAEAAENEAVDAAE